MQYNRLLRVNPATLSLMIAMFFNPLGFDALFKMVMDWTGSYWITDVIFYGASAFFFILYYLLKKRYVKLNNNKQ
jgi:hypothetical protein